MFLYENIVRSVTRNKGDRVKLLAINDSQDEYIRRLSSLHMIDMYMAEDTCPTKQKVEGADVTYSYKLDNLGERYLDAIIVFSRIQSFEYAQRLSHQLHLPLIVVDFASYDARATLPFFGNINLEDPEILKQHHGQVTVGISNDICNSWMTTNMGINTIIRIPHRFMKVDDNADKILLDKNLPKEYINSLPFQVTPDLFTTDPQDAKIYLNLWQQEKPLMLNCMASGIPVISMESHDLKHLINNEIIVKIESVDKINRSWFDEIKNFEGLETAKNNANLYRKEYTIEQFEEDWNRILEFWIMSDYYRRD